MKDNKNNMGFIETCIKKPIIPLVISIFTILLGYVALLKLEIRNTPKIPSNKFQIITSSRNPTSPQEIEKIISTKIERLLPSVPGIEEFKSTSEPSKSTITVTFKAGVDEINAFNDLRSVLSRISLGADIHPPEIYSQADDEPMLNLYFYPKDLNEKNSHMINQNNNENKIDNMDILAFDNLATFLKEVFIQNVKKIDGVGNVEIVGDTKVEFNIDLDLLKMSRLGIMPDDVSRSISNETQTVTLAALNTNTRSFSLTSPNKITSKFLLENIIIDSKKNISLKDIAKVTVKNRNMKRISLLNGETPTIKIFIYKTSEGNPLLIINKINSLLKELIKDDIQYNIKNNYANSEIIFNNTKKTFVEAVVLLFIILIFFLGSIKILGLPLIAIPLSIAGTLLFVWQLKFTINEITLMAFLLAIGLLVDDAILIIEKIERERHKCLLEGKEFNDDVITYATLNIYKPVIVMTATLFCVFLPVVFLPGEMGYTLREFAITISISVGWSCIFSLILTPMMCKYFMKNYHPFVWTEKLLQFIEKIYKKILLGVFRFKKTFLMFTIILTIISGYLFINIKSEYNPPVMSEYFAISSNGLESYKIKHLEKEINKIKKIFDQISDKYKYIENFYIDITDGEIEIRGKINNQKKNIILPLIKEELKKQIPYITFSSYNKDEENLYFNIIFSSYEKANVIKEASYEFLDLLKETGKIKDYIFIKDESYSYKLDIDEKKCSYKGVNPEEVRKILEFILQSTKLKGKILDDENNKYSIIVNYKKDLAANLDKLHSYHWRMKGYFEKGFQPLNIRDLVTITPIVSERSITKFNGLKSKTVQILCKKDVTAGEISKLVRDLQRKNLPKNIYLNVTGDVKEYEANSGQIVYIFLACLLSIFLILAVLFNSFLKSATIMLTVPLAFTGAIFILYFYGSINIYSTIGAITLVALITKHGILFMNSEGEIVDIAIERLRPVLMTTIAMILGNIPLLLYTDEAMVPLKQMAYVIVPGLTYGTIMVLFVFPIFLDFLKKRGK
jgi:multidrug efflux pump